MKRILSLLLFAIFCMAAHAEWIETAESKDYVIYVNDNITKDYSGYYLVWTKYVAKSSALAKERRELYNIYKKAKCNKFTHRTVMTKYDLKNNKCKTMSIIMYASDEVIESINNEYLFDWEYPVPESVGEGVMEMVKLMVSLQNSDY